MYNAKVKGDVNKDIVQHTREGGNRDASRFHVTQRYKLKESFTSWTLDQPYRPIKKNQVQTDDSYTDEDDSLNVWLYKIGQDREQSANGG